MNVCSFRGADKISRYLSNIKATLTENKEPDETINVKGMRKKIKNAIQEAADMTIEPIKYTKRKIWFDSECKNAIESRNKARLLSTLTP